MMADEATKSDEQQGQTSAAEQSSGASATSSVGESQSFAQQAQEEQMGLIAEFWDFLIHNKKWWLTPIIVVLLLVGLLVFLSGTAAAPFIYPL